jgi:hypothetical protein
MHFFLPKVVTGSSRSKHTFIRPTILSDMTDAHMSASKLYLRKINIFHTISDEVDFYIKIVALDEMYNYVEFFVHLRSLRC